MTDCATMFFFKDIVKRVLKSSWFVIAAGIWVQCCTGASYDFSIYSESIKENLGYDQEQLDLISFWKDIGANVGIISGLLYDQFSPQIILAIAAVMGFVGNLFMWLSITAKIQSTTLWLMCLYAFLASNSQTFSNTAAVVTCVKIFPRSRGTVVGLMKGSFGLSGAVLVQLYYAAYGTKEESFPLLLSWLVPLVCLTFIFVIRPLPAVETENQRKSLNMFSAILLVLAGYLLGTIILQNCISLERPWHVAILGGIIAILMCPIGVAVKSELDELGSSSVETDALLNFEELETSQEKEISKEITSHFLSRSSSGSSGVDVITTPTKQSTKQPQRGENHSLLQAGLSVDFWLLFFISACAMGSGLATINNMSQLGSSLNYTENELSTFVSLWSIWNFLGRFGGGYVSEIYLQSRGIPRPAFMIISLAFMIMGHIIIAIAFPGALYIGPVFVGICYGTQWSLMPSIASEIYGLKSFGAVFNTIAVASPLGSYILSVKVLGYLYDLEAEKDSLWSDSLQFRHQGWWAFISSSTSCNGAHCFRLTFFIMAGVCMAGTILSSVLFLRTRTFYREQSLLFRISRNG